MKILLDNVESVINVNEYESFQVLLWDIEKTIETKGRVITALKVDGMNLDNLFHFSLQEISILEISSKSPIMLLEEALHELNTYIDRFFLGIEDIVSNFKVGNKAEGVDNLVEGIYGIEWIFQILRRSEELLSLNDEVLEKIYLYSDDVLIKLTEAINNKDYDRITILLEFDLYLMLNKIKAYVPKLLKLANQDYETEIFLN